MKWFLLLLFLPVVSADIVISQVFFDPINESGSEAIELKNTGSVAVDIGGWVISTESSLSDVKFPVGTFILPGASFLVADSGWSTKRDSLVWRLADLEDTMTLGNSDSGIALKDSSNTTIDAVGWGDFENIDVGLFSGSPLVGAGISVLRVGFSGDNGEDFVFSSPSFGEGLFVPVVASVSFLQDVSTSDVLKLSPVGVLDITNNLDSSLDIVLVVDDLWSSGGVVSKENIVIESSAFTLGAREKKQIKFEVKTPKGVSPGQYASVLRIKYS